MGVAVKVSPLKMLLAPFIDPDEPSVGYFSCEAEESCLIDSPRAYDDGMGFFSLHDASYSHSRLFYPGELSANQPDFDVELVLHYADLYVKGSPFPKILVCQVEDGVYICNGHHRSMAAALLGVALEADVYVLDEEQDWAWE